MSTFAKNFMDVLTQPTFIPPVISGGTTAVSYTDEINELEKKLEMLSIQFDDYKDNNDKALKKALDRTVDLHKRLKEAYDRIEKLDEKSHDHVIDTQDMTIDIQDMTIDATKLTSGTHNRIKPYHWLDGSITTE